MLPSLKKKSKDGASSLSQAWHPNFRNYQRLPDIKVIRTAFFVNGGAVLAAVALLVFLGIRELELRSYNSQISTQEASIAENQGESTKAVALYGKFKEQESRVREVDTFVKSKLVVSELLQRFGDTRPKNASIDSIEFKDTGITLRATFRGTADIALSDAQGYQDQLRNDPVFFAKFESVDVVPGKRDPQSGRTPVDIFMKLRTGPAPAAKK